MHIRDLNGFMPVHVAAASENAQALRTLLFLDPHGTAEDLKDRKNKDGITPLEGLESSMRSTRVCMETLVGMWKGYSNEALSCEYLLKKALGLPMMAVSEEEYIKKRRFGCTCGMCTDGWLSPRVRFQLLGGFLGAALNKSRIIGLTLLIFFSFVSSPSRNPTRHAPYGRLLLPAPPAPLRL